MKLLKRILNAAKRRKPRDENNISSRSTSSLDYDHSYLLKGYLSNSEQQDNCNSNSNSRFDSYDSSSDSGGCSGSGGGGE